MKLRKIRDTVIYRHERWYCGPGPSAVSFGDGEILVVFRRVHQIARGHFSPCTEACCIRSFDKGLTWEDEPTVFAWGGVKNWNAIGLSDGSVLAATSQSELVTSAMIDELGDKPGVARGGNRGWPSVTWGVEAYRSADRGKSWDGPHQVTPKGSIPGAAEPALPQAGIPTNLRGTGLEMDDDTVVWPVYTTGPPGPVLMSSADGGVTWAHRGTVGPNKGLNETAIQTCPTGKMVAFMRCDNRGINPRYHDRRVLFTATSTDLGRTWSEPVMHDVVGVPFHTISMPGGNVLLVYGCRDENPLGIRARLIDPECEDIAGAEEIILRDDGATTDLGYPESVLLPDGTALVTYYINDENNTVYVGGTVVREASET